MFRLLLALLFCGDPLPAATFYALPGLTVPAGQPVELGWAVVGATDVWVETDDGWQSVPAVGKCWVMPKQSRWYALLCWNDCGGEWCEVGILVEDGR